MWQRAPRPYARFRDFFENSGNLSKIDKNRLKSHFRYLENGVLKLHRAATLQPRKIERSGFFSPGVVQLDLRWTTPPPRSPPQTFLSC